MTTWIGTMMDVVPAKSKDEEKVPIGTHQGRIGDPDARARRKVKNLRNRSHRGEAMRKAGSSHRGFRRKPGTGVKSAR